MSMRCADVTFDMGDGSFDRRVSLDEARVGSLLWNPKSGEGHVVVAEAPCRYGPGRGEHDCGCGGWGSTPCPSITLVCECGEDGSWRDHHYGLLAEQGPTSTADKERA